MDKTRDLALIYLIFIFCQLATTTTSLTGSDCKLLPPECALIQDNDHVFCYLFYGTDNAYNYTLRKLNTNIMMLAQKEIQISGGNVQAYWNHQTANIILEIPKEYYSRKETKLSMYQVAPLVANGLFTLFIRSYDIELKQTVNPNARYQQVTLDCSIFGIIYETSNLPVIEFWFNNSRIDSCTQLEQLNEPQTNSSSANQPYARLLNATLCRLTIPRAMESYTGDYQCRTELHLNTSSKLQQNCYLLSKPVTVFVTPLDNNISTTTTVTDPYTSTSMYTTNMTPTQHTKNPIIHIVVPASASVGGVIVITLISVLVVYKCVKYYCQQRQPYNGELLEGEIHNNQEVQNGFIEHGDIRNDDNEGDGNGVAAEERHRLLDFQGGADQDHQEPLEGVAAANLLPAGDPANAENGDEINASGQKGC